MKKRILTITLTILLMIGMLIGLTACGEKDDKEEKKSESTGDIKKLVSEFVDCINDKDSDGLAKIMDVKGMVAYSLSKSSGGDVKIDKAYDFICDLEKGADYLNKNYGDVMEAVGEEITQDDVDSMIDSIEETDIADMFSSVLTEDTKKAELKSTDDVKKEDDGTYSIKAEIAVDDETSDMTFYCMKIKGEYKIIYANV